MTQASEAIADYHAKARLSRHGRVRFEPANARRETDPKLNQVYFWHFDDGSSIRKDRNDIQEF